MLLNITPDHLDRHGSFDAYVEAKRRIFVRQDADDVAVVPDELEPEPGGEAVRLRFGESDRAALRLLDGKLRWRGEPLLPAAEIPLPGAHNVQNAMAAATACLARDLPRAAVAEGLRTFAGVPHRLELVTTRRGVRYINDSKATNVDSTLVALRSFPGDVHLILGGKGKSQDFTPLASLVSERCAAVYLIGEDCRDDRRGAVRNGVALIPAGDLERAVTLAARAAAAMGRSCCCRRPARVSTSTATTRPAAITSAHWHSVSQRGATDGVACHPPAGAAARTPHPGDRHALSARVRGGDGVQRIVVDRRAWAVRATAQASSSCICWPQDSA